MSDLKVVNVNAAESSLRRSISVLVPALNEVDNLRPTVETLLRALSETADEFEIIVVDDGSSDGTKELADRLAAEISRVRVLHNERPRGIGHAYMRGCEVARGDHFVYIPGDNTRPYEFLPAAVRGPRPRGRGDLLRAQSTS